MSDTKTKYVTFRDLREVRQAMAPAAAPALEKPSPQEPLAPLFPALANATGSSSTSTSSTSTPSSTSTTSITRKNLTTPSPASQRAKQGDVTGRVQELADSGSPRRDFQKIPNSIIREALPERLFRGKSKQVWDYLWSISRGAITPGRTLKKSRNEIKNGSGLGSMVTVDAALLHLESVGLIAKRQAIGSPGGNEYEIFSLEEAAANFTSIAPSQAAAIGETGHFSNAGDAPNNEAAPTSRAFAQAHEAHPGIMQDFAAVLLAAGETVLGAELPVNSQERKHWRTLGELLAEELKEAAQKAKSVTSVPAFLTAHLKRKLKAKEAKKVSPASKPKKDAPQTGRSQFSLAECRLYADNLQQTKQGIKNPGGFAMAIHQSGLADTMIAGFLQARKNPGKKASVTNTPNLAQPLRLSVTEIAEQVSILSDLLQHGFTLADAERQYGQFIHPEDWAELQQKLTRHAPSASA